MVMDLGGWNNDGFFSYRLSREARLAPFKYRLALLT
jgi:hypothetical protein